MVRLSLAVAMMLTLAVAGCGGGEPSSGQPSEAAAGPGQLPSQAVPSTGDAPAVDSARFVFGAVPGKPVIYWIHTDW